MWGFYYIQKLSVLINISDKVVQCSFQELITMKNSADVFSEFLMSKPPQLNVWATAKTLSNIYVMHELQIH